MFAMIIAWFAFDAMSQMVFGAIGVSMQDPAWIYTLALQTSSAIAGLATAIWSFSSKRTLFQRITIALAGATSGAVFCFYYGGVFAENNPKVAIAAAVIGGMVAAIVGFFNYSSWLAITIAVTGAIAGYGFAFMLGATAAQYLSVYNLVVGGGVAIITLGWLRLTLNSFYLIARTIKRSASTSFSHADIDLAQFEKTALQHADFSNTNGHPY